MADDGIPQRRKGRGFDEEGSQDEQGEDGDVSHTWERRHGAHLWSQSANPPQNEEANLLGALNEDANKKGICRRLYDKLPDADEVFAYQTVQELIVIDRRLGYVQLFFFFVVFCYVVVWNFFILKKYLVT